MAEEDILLLVATIIIILFFVIILYARGFRLSLIKEISIKEKLFPKHVINSNITIHPSDDIERTALHALSTIEDGVLILNEDHLVEYMNDAAQKIFNSKTIISGQMTFVEAVRDYECDVLLKKCISTGQEQNRLIKNHHKKQLLDVTTIPDPLSGRYIVIVRDLTEKQKLEEINRDLISNVSHELRTPIASIKLLAETLINGADQDKEVHTEFLQKIDVEAEKLAQMVSELRDISRMDNHEPSLSKGLTDVCQLIEQAVGRVEPQAEKRNIKIIKRYNDKLPEVIMDSNRIESVLINLIYNAVKFTEPGGMITVEANADEKDVCVSVADTGIGIPRNELKRIFERFYKVDKSRSSEGSGLGLTISRHIVSAHGGKIWAESEEGKGSTFCFTLPLPE